MATTITPKISHILLLLLLLFSSSPSPAKAILPFQQWRTLVSLSHSLMIRVSQLRASRGDLEGSLRARIIADKLEAGLGLWRGMWSVGWDYLRNYAWSSENISPREMFGAVSDLSQLLRDLNELTRLESASERAAWVMRNYQRVFVSSRSVVTRLLQVFFRSGPVRDLVLSLQRELEGGLLRDCVELGSSDLNGLVQVLRDLVLQFSHQNGNRHNDL